MPKQLAHAVLVDPDHDEQSRQDYYMDIRRYLAGNVAPGNKVVYHTQAKPAFEKEKGREPKDRHEVRKVMTRNGYYQMYSAMQRHTQEMTWDSVIDTVERDLPRIKENAKKVSGKTGGTLTLDPNFEVPYYLTYYDIHLQPGAYHASYSDDDVSAGALYDRGTFLYTLGNIGARMDYIGRTLLEHYKKLYPDTQPKRILDMGCSVGQSTIAWAEAFPEAEIHAIDVGESLLRYAHARAEDLGFKIHFSQQDAEKTSFEDGSFDVVLSHIMMHETSTPAVVNIFTESRRLLRDGGVMMHMDNPRLKELPPLESFLAEWEVYNNNERFGGTYREMDLAAEAVKAGFSAEKSRMDLVETYKPGKVMNYGTSGIRFPACVAEK
jgi:ubiquinone/menaquinone biosynthesis C-methylase UbiE